jgi:hypothetical protein
VVVAEAAAAKQRPASAARQSARNCGRSAWRLAPDTEHFARCNADAARQVYRRTESRHADLRNALTDTLGDRLCGRGVGAAQDHHEFLAAVTADHVRLAQLRLNRADDGLQAGIARRVSMRIVDLFEVIQIDEQQPDR